MHLASDAFADQSEIPTNYTCKGANVSPPLRIEDIPPGTQSLVLIMHDPDAPNGDFTHWTLWNMSPASADIPEGTIPADTVQGVTSFGTTGYGGPCPPSGTHRYMFELYALDTLLDLPEGTQRQEVETAMQGHVISQTLLTGLVSA